MTEFKKNIQINENQLIIEITCPHQVYSSEERIIFREDIWDSIPEEYKKKVKLISSPGKKVSNIKRDKYTNLGVWVFEIIQEQKPTQQKTRPSRARRQKEAASARSKKN